MVLHRMGLVFHGVELLTVRYVRLMGNERRGVRQQSPEGRSLAMGGGLKVLGAAGPVFDIIHGRVLVRSLGADGSDF
jgi:hypothetical protein